MCGAVRFEALGSPKYVFHCHCFSCRRQSGAAVATFAGFRVAGIFRWTRGDPAAHASSPGVVRRFCARCGTPLSYEAERLPDEVHLAISGFDEPELLPPEFHVHLGKKVAWFDMADHLPRFVGSSEAAEPS